MFTIEQIKAAHAKVKTGADFPKYISDIKSLGVFSYETFVTDGHTVFTGSDGHQQQWEAKYPAKLINDHADKETLVRSLKEHQQGATDYLTFCSIAASCGVEKWKVDITKMTCTYLDRKGGVILLEHIPS